MTSPIIAFLAGAGTGYLKQRDVEDQRKRDDEDQQFKKDQREVWRKQQADADALNQSLKQAQAPAEVVEGPLGDQSAGPPVPVALSQGGTGQPSPQSFRMVAPGVNKSFSSAADAQQAVTEYAKPEAMNQRVVAAYRGAGLADKAMAVESNANQGQLAKMQLDQALLNKSNAEYDQSWMSLLANSGQIAERLGKELGSTVQAVPTPDGKSMQFVSVGADGKQTPLHAPVANNQDGWTPLVMQQLKSIDPTHKLQFNFQQAQLRQQQANNDREFELKKQARDDDREYKRGVLALRGAGSGGKSGSAEAPAFDSLYDFEPKQARKAAMDQALEEAKNSSTPMSEKQIATRAQALYGASRDAAAADNVSRERARVFGEAARKARSPEEIQSIKDRAIKSGFTEEEMGRIDPRFSPTPAPKQAAPSSSKPTPKKASAPVIAEQVGAALPPAAEAAGVRLDKARADLAQLRASRPPSLKDGNAARQTFARQIKAAEDELDAADAAYQGAASPFVAAAYGTHRK